MPTASSDPDLNHLFELLRMLPGPAEAPEFWTDIQHQFIKTELGYVFEKMTSIWHVVQDPSPGNIAYLAKYLMMFFGGDNPELWKILNGIFQSQIDLRHDHPGRWWRRMSAGRRGHSTSVTASLRETSGQSNGGISEAGMNGYPPGTPAEPSMLDLGNSFLLLRNRSFGRREPLPWHRNDDHTDLALDADATTNNEPRVCGFRKPMSACGYAKLYSWATPSFRHYVGDQRSDHCPPAT